MEYERLNIYQLRAEVRRMFKYFQTCYISDMKRQQAISILKAFSVAKEIYDENMKVQVKTKVLAREIPVVNEIVDEVAFVVPVVPAERPSDYLKIKKACKSKDGDNHDKQVQPVLREEQGGNLGSS